MSVLTDKDVQELKKQEENGTTDIAECTSISMSLAIEHDRMLIQVLTLIDEEIGTTRSYNTTPEDADYEFHMGYIDACKNIRKHIVDLIREGEEIA